eukprot:jgi/Psemu1/328964/estExt_fgenesh1_pg.C_38090001
MDRSALEEESSTLHASLHATRTTMNDNNNNNNNNFSMMGSVTSPTPTVQQQKLTPGSINTTLQHRSHLSAFTPIRPVLTPRETPRGTSMGLVLLSPSRTITETLNALASSTAQQLEEIWDEVGYTPQERASQLSDLLEKFRSQRISGSLVRSKDSSFMMVSKFETETCTGISAKALEALTSRASELSREKRRRKGLLQDMGGQIAILWEQLSIPLEEQQAFTNSVKGLGMDTIEKGSAELERLKTLKNGMLGKLIQEARDSIQQLWKETNGTYEQRKSFEPFNVRDEDLFDDELLDEHESYIVLLQDRLEKMKPINRIIERREDILQERMEYEELQKDSDRLKQRGAAMAKQLMEEEKMARRIKKELPRLTKMLQEKLREWKESHSEDFQYQGQIYFDVMKRQDEEWAEYKKNEVQMKLRKKQDHQIHEENRLLGKMNPVGRKKPNTRPLGDSSRVNKMNATREKNDVDKKALPRANTGHAKSRTYA